MEHVVPTSEFARNFGRHKDSGRSFATIDLPEEKAKAISASRVDPRHAHLDTMLDE